MNGAPHPMLDPLWHEAGAASATMRALRCTEPALDALAADPFAVLVDTASIDWAAEEQDGNDAMLRALDRLRTTQVPPRASVPRKAAADAPTNEPGDSPAAAPGDGPSVEQDDRPSPMEPEPEPEQTATAARSLPLGTPSHRVAAEWAEPIAQAARQPIGVGTTKAAVSRSVELILEGRRPSASTLLEAIGLPSERHEPVTPSVAQPGSAALAGALSRVDAARRIAAPASIRRRSRADPMSADALPAAHTDSIVPETFTSAAPPMPTAPASGFRRLAAMFTTQDTARTSRIVETRDAGPAPVSPFNAPVPSAQHRPVGIVEHARFDVTREVIPPALRAINDDAVGDAEMAERLARILRREARRQGIADEGGAA